MTKFYLSINRFLTVLLVLTSVLAWSQSRTVTGKVTSSDDGSGIPGANIQIKGTSTGTVTNSDGSFSISASDTDVLVFSFVGYATQEITVGSQSTISVALQPDVTALSEVVVVGYGTVRVKDATGAVAAVGVADFNGGLISSAEQLIQGKTAGVQVVSTSGQPGAGVQLRIRGSNSIRSNNNPLFVVDGVPLAGGTQPASADVGLGSSQDTNPLNFINPNDIESMSILKDASAAAIYGSRGANGVVLITTKSGKGGKGKFALNSSVSVSSPANSYDLLGREDYLAAVSDFGGTPVDAGSNTDWQDYLTRTSVSTTQNLSYNKGFATGAIRASFGYENLVGVMENSNMQRITGRVNGNKKFLDNKLNIELAGTFSNVNREDPAISGNAGFQGDILGAAYSANPTWPTDPDFNPGGQRSPANLLKYFQSTGTTNRFLTSLSASYQLNNNFLAKALYGIDVAKADNLTLNSGKTINGGNGVGGNGQGQISENKNLNNLLELTLNYTKTLGNINIDVVGGYSFQSFHNEWYWAAGRGFDDPDSFGGMESELNASYSAMQSLASDFGGTVNNWGAANTLIGGGSSPGAFVSGFDSDGTRQEFSAVPSGVTIGAFSANFYDQTDYLQSYFGRGNFTIAQKYLITATVRVDGSSKFGPNNQYGVFPSGAVAWKIHDEDFMPDAFSTFKLRAGYGIVGNQDGLSYGQFIRRERWADVNLPGNGNIELGVPGTTTQGDVNPDLKWEETTTAGVGIDFGFIGDKLTGTFDWYSKSTTDLLLRIETAQPAQQPTIFANFDAIVENVGWEISLSYAAVDNESAAFNISGNLSHNDNMVKDFAGALNAGQIYGQGLSGAYAQQLSGGHPLFSYHLREFEGFDTNGQPIGDNQTFIGKGALPVWNMGLSLSGRYKAFDFSMYFAGQYGHYIYNNTQNAFFTAGSIFNGRNVTRDVLGSGESGSAEAAVSTRFLHSGNFTRLQNLSVGYTVPKTGLNWLSELRFYVTGQNLFVISDYNGLDPEVSSNPANYSLLNGLPTAGIDYAAYPRPRTFTLGLKATF